MVEVLHFVAGKEAVSRAVVRNELSSFLCFFNFFGHFIGNIVFDFLEF